MKRFLALALLGTTALACAGQAARADMLDDIMKAGKIRIATDLAIPPSGMIDSAMKPTGSDVETAELLAAYAALLEGRASPDATLRKLGVRAQHGVASGPMRLLV